MREVHFFVSELYQFLDLKSQHIQRGFTLDCICIAKEGMLILSEEPWEGFRISRTPALHMACIIYEDDKFKTFFNYLISICKK